MTDDSLIADLIRAGLTAELVGRVSGALLSVALRRQTSADESADGAYDRRRKRDREYQKAKRLQAKTGKQTMSGFKISSADESADAPTNGHLLTNLSSLLVGSTTKERKIKREQASLRRGSRLQSGTPMIAGAQQFAAELGFDSVSALWAEFVDYWAAVPGQRGVKLDWLATWRNHCRRVADRQGLVPPAVGTMSADAIPQPPRPGLPTHEELKARYGAHSTRNAG